MQKLIAIVLLWIWPPLLMPQQASFYGQNFDGGRPSPTFEVSNSAAVGSGTTTSLTLTVAGGEAIIIAADWSSTTGFVSLTDTNGVPADLMATISQPTVIQWASSSRSQVYFYEKNAAAGTHTIAVTIGANTLLGLLASAYSGASTTAPIDFVTVPNIIAAIPSPNLSCNPVTTHQLNGTIVAFGTSTSASVATNAGSGYTVRARPSGFTAFAIEDRTVSTISTYTAAFSTATSTPGICTAVALK